MINKENEHTSQIIHFCSKQKCCNLRDSVPQFSNDVSDPALTRWRFLNEMPQEVVVAAARWRR
jgi:hypothetical protein